MPGDLIVLLEGDRVPADAELLFCTKLSADEAFSQASLYQFEKSALMKRRQWLSREATTCLSSIQEA